MRLVLIGYGRMGRMVESLAPEYGAQVVGVVDIGSPDGLNAESVARWGQVDVAIDFTSPDAVPVNLPAAAVLGLNLVIGTTGWGAHETSLREIAAARRIGVVAAPNFSIGVVLFEAIVSRAAELFASQDQFGAWLHEAHHAAKKDAPSGTALFLKAAMERAGLSRTIDVSSTRAGFIPGVHEVGFDGPAESITLVHTARDRTAFARGALLAARWVVGRTGWFSMRDVLGLG